MPDLKIRIEKVRHIKDINGKGIYFRMTPDYDEGAIYLTDVPNQKSLFLYKEEALAIAKSLQACVDEMNVNDAFNKAGDKQ